MQAKDLIEILQKLPEDTLICKTSGETGCSDLNSAKYFPQYNILYIEPYWARKSRDFIDMADGDTLYFGGHSGSPHCPFSKDELLTIRGLARTGKEIVDAKADGKMHHIQVKWMFDERELRNAFALKVDGADVNAFARKEVGEHMTDATELGVSVCDFEWESLGSKPKEAR